MVLFYQDRVPIGPGPDLMPGEGGLGSAEWWAAIDLETVSHRHGVLTVLFIDREGLQNWIGKMKAKLKLNSLAPGGFEWNFRKIIFNVISVTDDWGIFWGIAFIWVSLDIN